MPANSDAARLHAPLKAVLFDLDCTLIDRGASIRRYADCFAAHFSQHLHPACRPELAGVMLTADRGGYSKATRTGDLLAGLRWRAAPAAAEIEAHWKAHFSPLAVPMDGAAELLELLRARGLQLALVSNGTVAMQQRKLDILGLTPHFDAIVISEGVGTKKPSPEIFAHTLELLGVSAPEAWFVGDHPINDVQGAAAVGMTTVWLSGSQPWPDGAVLPHYTIGALRELPPLLSL